MGNASPTYDAFIWWSIVHTSSRASAVRVFYQIRILLKIRRHIEYWDQTQRNINSYLINYMNSGKPAVVNTLKVVTLSMPINIIKNWSHRTGGIQAKLWTHGQAIILSILSTLTKLLCDIRSINIQNAHHITPFHPHTGVYDFVFQLQTRSMK